MGMRVCSILSPRCTPALPLVTQAPQSTAKRSVWRMSYSDSSVGRRRGRDEMAHTSMHLLQQQLAHLANSVAYIAAQQQQPSRHHRPINHPPPTDPSDFPSNEPSPPSSFPSSKKHRHRTHCPSHLPPVSLDFSITPVPPASMYHYRPLQELPTCPLSILLAPLLIVLLLLSLRSRLPLIHQLLLDLLTSPSLASVPALPRPYTANSAAPSRAVLPPPMTQSRRR